VEQLGDQVRRAVRHVGGVSSIDPTEALGLIPAPEAIGVPVRPLGIYVSRDAADAELDLRLTAPVSNAMRIISLVGPAKAGKSRTMWEGIARNLPAYTIVALRQALPGQLHPLNELLAAGRTNLGAESSRIVFWIDDAHEHLRAGLHEHNLRALSRRYPGCVLAATFTTGVTDTPLCLPEGFADPVKLSPKLTPDEVIRAQDVFGDMSTEELAVLPQRLSGIHELWKRYTQAEHKQPIGWALVRVAFDWHRLGAGPGIPHSVLAEITRWVLARERPGVAVSDAAIAHGLEWATRPVGRYQSLLRPVHIASHETRLGVIDALVERDAARRRIDPTVRKALYAEANARLSAGDGHWRSGRLNRAQAAYREAIAQDPELAPKAMFSLGYLLRMRGKWKEAEATYRDAIATKHPDVAPTAMVNLGYLLRKRGRWEEAEEAYRDAIATEHPYVSPTALVNLGYLMKYRRRWNEAESAYKEAIAIQHPDIAATAIFNLGELLQERGRWKEAQTAYQAAIAFTAIQSAQSHAIADEDLHTEVANPERDDEQSHGMNELSQGMNDLSQGMNEPSESFEELLDREDQPSGA
jgi:tetratricopeptide (TPR) repeat protein